MPHVNRFRLRGSIRWPQSFIITWLTHRRLLFKSFLSSVWWWKTLKGHRDSIKVLWVIGKGEESLKESCYRNTNMSERLRNDGDLGLISRSFAEKVVNNVRARQSINIIKQQLMAPNIFFWFIPTFFVHENFYFLMCIIPLNSLSLTWP